jgi:hypothetical protein
MKRLIQILFSAWVTIINAGCVNSLDFRVVDASSGKRLFGVTVLAENHGPFYYFVSERRFRNLGSTDTNGHISVRGIRTSDVIFFNLPDYRGATAGYVAEGKIGFGPYPPINVDTMFLEQQVVDDDFVIEIPLIPTVADN